MKKLRAIDLYSGIGGWSLGLRLNNIDVLHSYEWWDQAVKTANKNLGKKEEVQNIRKMDFSKLKDKKIDIVVGSPPCTQFSYSNRGGSGDISDGIIDLYKFFECVQIVKPKFWAMENVPRVAGVILRESQKGGKLYKFKKIIDEGFVEVFNMREYGVPQKRKRCIASNVDLELLRSYTDACDEVSLERVLSSLSKDKVSDPNFRVSRSKKTLTEMEMEEPLNEEEERINENMKINHPIFNRMSFPEDEKQPARTITATCTRVSRESLVIKDKSKYSREKSKYRRLSVRERASVQGFPINYEFHGSSHSNKLKMIGNAIPPKFTYFIAAAMKGIALQKLVQPNKVRVPLEKSLPDKTTPDTQSKKYPATRSFKIAMSNLNFKSGTRFELNNSEGRFRCFFYYGDSKRIRNLVLDKSLFNKLERFISRQDEDVMKKIMKTLKVIKKYNHKELQTAWSVKPPVGDHPFHIVDLLNSLVMSINDQLADIEDGSLLESMDRVFNKKDEVGRKKVAEHYRKIFCGLIICSYFNGNN